MCDFKISLRSGPQTIAKCVGVFAGYTLAEPEHCDLIDAICNIFFGSKKTRIGNAPTVEQFQEMANIIKPYVLGGLPIQALTPWGAAKGYSLDTDRLGVDMGDLLAVRRLTMLHEQISAIYPPGIVFNIFQEDITEGILSTAISTDLPVHIAEYRTGLMGLTKAFGIPANVINETILLARRGLNESDFLQQGRNNAGLFEAYWAASESTGVNNWADIAEYKNLQGLGWNGIIAPETRAYYMERILVERPDATPAQQAKQVCQYLGIALARYQLKMLHLGENRLIKLVFNGHPPGTPASQFMGRVQYKLKDSKSSNTATPPWVGYGFIEERPSGYEPTVISIRQMEGIKAYKATAQVESAFHCQEFRCDLLAA